MSNKIETPAEIVRACSEIGGRVRLSMGDGYIEQKKGLEKRGLVIQ